ncbi:anti-sigma regulatory factor [Ectothiorhodospiraceae bacterium BW-2]|nr:anti-sigma regulatory factor [Ectothiorhodospiraceae bacterium BW-2]
MRLSTTPLDIFKVTIVKPDDIIQARQEGRTLAKKLGFRIVDQTRLATAISELARNILNYAGEGVCHICSYREQNLTHIEIVAEDFGPGIADIEQAMQDGYSSGNGLGVGLPGTRRLVDQFEIESSPGHTRVTAIMSRAIGH